MSGLEYHPGDAVVINGDIEFFYNYKSEYKEFTVSLYDGDVKFHEEKVKEESQFVFPDRPKENFSVDCISTATGSEYHPGDAVVINEDIEFFYNYKPEYKEFTVSFYDGDLKFHEEKVKEGSSFVFPDRPKENFYVDCIVTTGSEYHPGDSVVINGDIEFFYVYKPDYKEFTVSLYDGDFKFHEEKVKEGSSFVFPDRPKENFDVDYITSTTGGEYHKGDHVVINEDSKFYYHFIRNDLVTISLFDGDVKFYESTIQIGTPFVFPDREKEDFILDSIGYYQGNECYHPGDSIVINEKSSFFYNFKSVYDLFELSDTADGYSITRYKGPGGTLIIPSMIGGKPVVEIGDCVFTYASSVEKIILPETIKRLGYCALGQLRNLKEIFIPKSAVEISMGLFLGDDSLVSVEVDPLNPVYHSEGNCVIKTETKELVAGCNASAIPSDGSVATINMEAFSQLMGLESLVIPENVIKVDDGAIMLCNNLKSISISKDCTNFAQSAILNWPVNLTSIQVDPLNTVYKSEGNCLIDIAAKTIVRGCVNSVIPSDGSVEAIGPDAFCSIVDLYSFDIPSGVKNIETNAFSDCENLKNVTLPDTLEYLDPTAFRGCPFIPNIPESSYTEWQKIEGGWALTGYTGPYEIWTVPKMHEGEPVLKIAEHAFYDTAIKDLTIPDSVKIIESYSIIDNFYLEKLTISKSVEEIQAGAIENNRWLVTFVVDANNPIYHSSGNCIIDTEKKKLIVGSVDECVIPADDSVEVIGKSAFCGGFIQSISIPSNIKRVETMAFRDCKELFEIILPDTHIDFEPSAFWDCPYVPEECFLHWKKIENGWEFIGYSGEKTRFEIPAVYQGEDVISMGYSHGIYNSAVVELVIPDSVKSLGERALSLYPGLREVNIPKNVMDITIPCFGQGITSLNVSPENTKYHSSGNCLIDTANKVLVAGFDTSVIPADGSVTIIGEHAFSPAANLTSIVIPEGITEIKSGAFLDCSNLKNVVLPSSIVTIAPDAFRDGALKPSGQ